MKILNFGSLNIDYTYHLDHFVRPGETESSFSRTVGCGGKGLNQSVALAKAGADVYHAGALGEMDGGILLDMLKKAGVHTEYVMVRSDVGSGNAFIQVNKDGENCIVLDGGANQRIADQQVEEVLSCFERGDWLLLQNEINANAVIMEKAAEKGMRIVLNPSPMNEKIDALPLHLVDIFLVNEEEAEHLAGTDQDVLEVLHEKYPRAAVVMTLGAKGSCAWIDGMIISQESFPAQAVDTTGAGDTYTGYLLAELMHGASAAEAMRTASCASALAVERNGAAAAVPERGEVLTVLNGKA